MAVGAQGGGQRHHLRAEELGEGGRVGRLGVAVQVHEDAARRAVALLAMSRAARRAAAFRRLGPAPGARLRAEAPARLTASLRTSASTTRTRRG